MTWRSGFWDSIGGDRKYTAEDMGILLDGVITDGVFANYGDAFTCTPNSDGSTVMFGSGKAWKNHRWTWNDTVLQYKNPPFALAKGTDVTYVFCIDWKTEPSYRYSQLTDFSFNNAEQGLSAYIEWLIGQYPNLMPIAALVVPAGSTTAQSVNITNLVGTKWTPWVTAPVQTVTVDDIRQRWEIAYSAELDRTTKELSDIAGGKLNEQLMSFNLWFAGLKSTLDNNQAGNLLNKINALESNFNKLVTDGELKRNLEFVTGNKLSPATTSAGATLSAVLKYTPLV